jgi:hypothetical protein
VLSAKGFHLERRAGKTAPQPFIAFMATHRDCQRLDRMRYNVSVVLTMQPAIKPVAVAIIVRAQIQPAPQKYPIFEQWPNGRLRKVA